MRRLIGTALAVSIFACAATELPEPALVPQTTASLVEVAFPPPPARVEVVPAQPVAGAVWIDGEWAWRGRRWAWKHGRWVIPPAGAAAYSPWTRTRNDAGTVFYAPGVWRNARGEELPEPAPIVTSDGSHDGGAREPPPSGGGT